MSAPNRGKVFIGGQEAKGVTRVSLSVGVDELPEVTITYRAHAVSVDMPEAIVSEETPAPVAPGADISAIGDECRVFARSAT